MEEKDQTIPSPQIGQKIYTDTQLFVSHGEDDFRGGVCTISKIDTLYGIGPWIEVAENPGLWHLWEGLVEQQPELKKKFGRQKGRKTPDYRPQCNQLEF